MSLGFIDLTDKTYLSAGHCFGASYGADAGVNTGPSCVPSESEKAEPANALKKMKAKEESLFLDFLPGLSEDIAQSDGDKMNGSINSYDSKIEAEKSSIQVTERDPTLCAAN